MLDRLKKLIKGNMPDADVEHATEATKLADLGIDSIGMMMLSMSMEEEFGVEFTDAIPFETVKDVLDYLNEHAKK
ncbi:MAG: acyl carrier protein [Bacilli bacterium]|nr:acyl carrier protein [Bacilli bacterium]